MTAIQIILIGSVVICAAGVLGALAMLAFDMTGRAFNVVVNVALCAWVVGLICALIEARVFAA